MQSIERLQVYIQELQEGGSTSTVSSGGASSRPGNGEGAANDASGFSNVYEVHSPQITLSNSTRNVCATHTI